MQRALFPMYNMRITQGYGVGTHKNSFAIDNAGKDTGIDNMFAPFDCVVRKIYTADANEVWIESIEKVQYADGTEDYMTIMVAHDNNVSDLKTGQVIKQGTPFYSEGTKGNATGNHVHIECGKGKFTGSGWNKNSAGYWSILNGKKPEDCLWVGSDVAIHEDGGYKWKKTETPYKPENTEVFNVGDRVKIVGKYSTSSTAEPAYTKAVGEVRYITKIYSGRKCPYQLGVKMGDTTTKNTTGFAPKTSISKV